MMRGRYDLTLLVGALALGFLVPLWPLVIAGILGSVAHRRLFVALPAAFVYDLLFGPWPLFFWFAFPMTAGTAIVSIVFLFMRRYVRAR